MTFKEEKQRAELDKKHKVHLGNKNEYVEKIGEVQAVLEMLKKRKQGL